MRTRIRCQLNIFHRRVGNSVQPVYDLKNMNYLKILKLRNAKKYRRHDNQSSVHIPRAHIYRVVIVWRFSKMEIDDKN
jgi:hypothetical protein